MKKKERIFNLNLIKLLLSVLIVVAGVLLVSHDAWLYTSPIALVQSVTLDSSRSSTSERGDQETYYTQTITLKLLNTSSKGKTYSLSNTYSSSHVKEEQYHTGDKVLLAISKSNKPSIVTLKRDTYLAFLLLLFIVAMAYVVGRKSIVILLSLALNIAIFIAAVFYHNSVGGNIRYVWVLLLAFTMCTLFLTNGFNRKSLGAICSVLVSVALVYGLFCLSLLFVSEPSYEMMSFIGKVDDLKGIFMAGILIGCLGAVCDVAITIHASLEELYEVNPTLSLFDVRSALKQISNDIGSTMINVLLFSYLSGSLPILILKIKTGYSMLTLIKYSLVFEITRFLLGSIAIIAAIPISAIIAISLHQLRRQTL